jgi:two-component system sensor histidine kinase BaeS
MRQKMAAISMDTEVSTFDPYPLYYGGRQIGTLYARQKKNSLLIEKEQTFKKRGKDFLLFSLLITGGSALLLSFLLASYLNRPLRKLSKAASEIATGNLNIRVKPTSADEIGKLSMTFNKMAEALERQEGLRKRLASNIAHELRTPLSIIKGHLEAILDGVMPAEAAQVESLLLEIDKLKKLIDGIEDITSLEAHSLYLEEREVEVGSFLKDIAKSMEPLFKAKGITFNFERTSDVSMVTDPDKLSHILFNLLNNALKYTDSGSVTLSYGLRPEGLFIAVADTGIGIREEEVPFIFERFYKGIKSEGIGLGLAIAKELAGAIGGNLEVKSRVGEGSVFTLRIGRI